MHVVLKLIDNISTYKAQKEFPLQVTSRGLASLSKQMPNY